MIHGADAGGKEIGVSIAYPALNAHMFMWPSSHKTSVPCLLSKEMWRYPNFSRCPVLEVGRYRRGHRIHFLKLTLTISSQQLDITSPLPFYIFNNVYNIFPIPCVPITMCSQYHVFQKPCVPNTMWSQYHVFPIPFVPNTMCVMDRSIQNAT